MTEDPTRDDLDRYERERSFHDSSIEGGVRAATTKYYVVDSALPRYMGLLSQVPSSAKVLEYGCGTGSAAFDLAARGVDALGIDISPKSVELARRSAQELGLRRASFEVMNAEALDLPDASFDVVCGGAILHHLDIGRAIAEVRRVVRPDGWAMFVEPLGTNPLINLYRRMTPKMRTVDEHPLVPADFDLMRARFTSVDVEFHNLLALAGAGLVKGGIGERLTGNLHRADDWMFRRSRLARRMAWTALIVLRP